MQKSKPIRELIQVIKKNPKEIGLIVVWDILFILLLVNLKFISSNLNGWMFIQSNGLKGIPYIITILSLTIFESLLLIAVYSFFKYLVLDNVIQIFKREFKFNRFLSFLNLNWMIFIPILFIYLSFFMLIMSYIGKVIIGGINNPFSVLLNLFAVLIVILLLFVYLYTLINLAHSIFSEEKSLKKTIKQAFINSFRLRSYGIYWSNLKIIFFSLFILLSYYGFMKLFVLTNITAYLKYGGIYKIGLIAITFLAGYFLLLFNRINFYQFILKKR